MRLYLSPYLIFDTYSFHATEIKVISISCEYLRLVWLTAVESIIVHGSKW